MEKFVDDYITYWQEFPDIGSSQFLVTFLCIKYSKPERKFSRSPAADGQQYLEKLKQRYPENWEKGYWPDLVCLEPLTSISLHDITQWATSKIINCQCESQRQCQCPGNCKDIDNASLEKAATEQFNKIRATEKRLWELIDPLYKCLCDAHSPGRSI